MNFGTKKTPERLNSDYTRIDFRSISSITDSVRKYEFVPNVSVPSEVNLDAVHVARTDDGENRRSDAIVLYGGTPADVTDGDNYCRSILARTIPSVVRTKQTYYIYTRIDR